MCVNATKAGERGRLLLRKKGKLAELGCKHFRSNNNNNNEKHSHFRGQTIYFIRLLNKAYIVTLVWSVLNAAVDS